MILYYAGVARNTTDLYSALRAGGCRHLMLTYYYKNTPKRLKRYRRLGLHLFLDSGAYSAWKKGVEINLDEYIQYIKDNQFGKYINLDVIGDPDKTYQNMKYMESKGLTPVPVFHMGADYKYLEQLLAEGYQYICLGGTVGTPTCKRIEFFDEVFRNYPNTFFHGLGVNDTKLLERYPWFSVDATTWLVGRKYNERITDDGRIKLPEGTSMETKIKCNVEYLADIEEKRMGKGD